MNLDKFTKELKHLSSRLVIVDPEGHEVFDGNLGIYIHWVKKSFYRVYEIDYITPEDDNVFIIYLEGE